MEDYIIIAILVIIIGAAAWYVIKATFDLLSQERKSFFREKCILR